MKTRYAILKHQGRPGEFEFLCHCQRHWSKDLEATKADHDKRRQDIIDEYIENGNEVELASELAEDLARFDKDCKIVCLTIETVNKKWEEEQKRAKRRSTPIAGGYL